MTAKWGFAAVFAALAVAALVGQRLMPGIAGDAARAQSTAPSAGAGQKPGGRAGGSDRGAGKAVTVTATAAVAGALPIRLDTIGRVVPVALTALSSPAAGIIAEINVADGATVKKGALIARLDDRMIRGAIERDNAQIAKDQAALAAVQATYERTQSLVGSGAATKQAGDDARAAVDEAEATLNVDRALLSSDQVALDNTEIRVPFDGQLGAFHVSVGAFVGPGTAIVSLTQMQPVLAEIALPETALDLARQALADGTLMVSVRPVLAPEGRAAVTGPVVFIDNAVDPASATFSLRARLANEDGALWPGQSLAVGVTFGQSAGLVLVPGVAVMPQTDGSVSYVVKSDGTVEMRKVTVAMRDGTTAGISDGLVAGDMVVTEGQQSLSDGAKVTVANPPAATAANPPAATAE